MPGVLSFSEAPAFTFEAEKSPTIPPLFGHHFLCRLPEPAPRSWLMLFPGSHWPDSLLGGARAFIGREHQFAYQEPDN
jgi:hypothetical protein